MPKTKSSSQKKPLYFTFGCDEYLYEAFRKYQEITRWRTSIICVDALKAHLEKESAKDDRFAEVKKLLQKSK